MATFIAKMIRTQADIELKSGQDKYRAYFINTSLYTKWQEDVDAILNEQGYEKCIVTE